MLLSTIVDFGALGGTLASVAINSSEVVAATGQTSSSSSNYSAAVLTSTGGNTPISPLPNYTSSFASAINDSGQVAGYSQVTSDEGTVTTDEAVLYSNGTVTGLGTLGGADSVATAIDTAGDVVGYSTINNDPFAPAHAFLYPSGGSSMEDLGTLGGNSSEATGINSSGEIVGYSEDAAGSSTNEAFVYQNGKMSGLAPLSTYADSFAVGVNASGEVAGNSSSATTISLDTASIATTWTDGTAASLGTLEGYSASYATAINDSGTVVGYDYNPKVSQSTPHAFLYNPSTAQLVDLNAVVKNNSGWVLETATGINNQGVIVGTGTFNGAQSGFLLYTSNGLLIKTQPSATATAGVAFATQPVVEEQNDNGVLEIWDNSTVVTAIDDTGNPLQGTTNETLVGGIATYTNLAYNVAPATITLTFYNGADTAGPSSSIAVSPAPAAKILITSTALSQAAGASGQVVVQLADQFGNVGATSATDQTIGLSTTSPDGAFYASPTSTTPITSVTIPAGQSSASVYYEDTLAGTPMITASDTAFNSTRNQTETINPGPVSQLAITSSALTLDAGSDGEIDFQLEDSYGNASPASTAQSITLGTTSSGGEFYLSPSNTVPLSELSIAAGQSSAVVYYIDTVAGTPILTIGDQALASAPTQQETIDALPASKLVFTTAPLVQTAGSEGEITLQLEDRYHNPAVSSTAQTIAFSTTSVAGAFYASAGSTTPITGVVLLPGQMTASVFYFDTTAGTPTVSAADSGLSSTPTQNETIEPLAPDQVVITSPAIEQVIGAFGAFTVELEDQYGNAAPSASNQTIGLSTTSGDGAFYLTSGGTTPTTSIVLGPGQTVATVYYEDTQPGHPTLTASDSALTSAPTQQATINSIAASQVAITSSALSLSAGSRGAIALTLEDPFGNVTTSSSNQTIALTTTSAGGAFYATATSTVAITSIVVPATETGVTVYYDDTTAGSPTVTASDSALDSAPMQPETIEAGPISQIAFTTSALSLSAGGRGQISVQLEDQYDNPATSSNIQEIFLSSTSPEGTFYLTQSSATPITFAFVAAGQTSLSIYYSDTKAGAPLVSVTDANFTGSAAQQESISPLAASQIAITSAALDLTAGTTGELTIALEDPYGNTGATSTSSQMINLTTSSGGVFYASSTSTTPITSATIVAGDTSTSVYYFDTRAGTPTVTANDSALDSAPMQPETIEAGPMSQIAITTSALSLSAGSRGQMTVQLEDQYDNPATSSSSQTISVSSTSPDGTFYLTQSSATPITSVAIAAGQTSASFYYSDTRAGAPSVTVSDASVTQGATQQESVSPLVASQIAITSAALDLTAGTSAPITIVLEDPYGNSGATFDQLTNHQPDDELGRRVLRVVIQHDADHQRHDRGRRHEHERLLLRHQGCHPDGHGLRYGAQLGAHAARRGYRGTGEPGRHRQFGAVARSGQSWPDHRRARRPLHQPGHLDERSNGRLGDHELGGRVFRDVDRYNGDRERHDPCRTEQRQRLLRGHRGRRSDRECFRHGVELGAQSGRGGAPGCGGQADGKIPALTDGHGRFGLHGPADRRGAGSVRQSRDRRQQHGGHGVARHRHGTTPGKYHGHAFRRRGSIHEPGRKRGRVDHDRAQGRQPEHGHRPDHRDRRARDQTQRVGPTAELDHCRAKLQCNRRGPRRLQ